MTAFAHCQPQLRHNLAAEPVTSEVLGMRHWFHVVGVYANRIAAKVIQLQATRDGATLLFVDPAMGFQALTVNNQAASPARGAVLPYPATSDVIDKPMIGAALVAGAVTDHVTDVLPFGAERSVHVSRSFRDVGSAPTTAHAEARGVGGIKAGAAAAPVVSCLQATFPAVLVQTNAAIHKLAQVVRIAGQRLLATLADLGIFSRWHRDLLTGRGAAVAGVFTAPPAVFCSGNYTVTTPKVRVKS